MTSTPQLGELAASISTATRTIEEHLKQRDLPSPSFEANGGITLPRELQQAKESILDSASELRYLLTDPVSAFFEGAPVGFMSIIMIHRFSIANLIKPDMEMSFCSIAEQTGLQEGLVKHVLRHAMTLRVFRESRRGFVAHTPRSVVMRDGDIARWMAFSIDELTGAILCAPYAMQKWPRSDEPNQTGFSLAENTDRAIYEVLDADPARGARMANAMNVWASSESYSVSKVVDSYDWSRLGSGTVVDIGGSRGQVAVAVASRFSALRFVVQDLESTIAGAEVDLPPQVADRVSFMAHDFFEAQSVLASAYFLRWVLHNWSDKYCIKILRALIPALRPGARVIVNEICMPEPGEVPVCRERLARTMGLGMIGLFNAYERDIEDWTRLFEQADPRFQLLGCRHLDGAEMALIEFEWTG
ncbi:sterigmatocystin 8-O-methyltransferase [Aspergillus brunneoviolaceus CBS 621.78]|uniref:Sterigmatocystin 8-O-methyltransferase n=1 Tax=Aspergillus brunneoviolaceus CBS 621.78 TaxID=1450534 RepID=A0ACD1G5S7_9EURO|nr:sterigmatocystin 8-O-methyltransferase [Aspergillus brunneoviolaceus CBS 621.78]RAH44621.1 sterigmatocystin 8-O-methyltransferase [Aspergillus brunneoviolaceus CBS 621.78]